MSNKIPFSQLIEELAEQTDTSQSVCHNFVTSLTELVINSAVESGKASITNLGSFSVVDVAARNGINPQTGEAIVIPTHQRLSFSPYKALENTVNAPFIGLEATIIEEKVKSPVFKNQKRKEEPSKTIAIILGSLFFLIIVIAGLWFFVFRDSGAVETAQENNSIVEQPAQSIPQTENLSSIPKVQDEYLDSTPVSEPIASDELPTEIGLVENVPLGTSSHIVSSNEWFYDIARNIYKTPTFWPLIFEANFTSSQDPDILTPGKILTIPSIENAQNPTLNDRIKLTEAATKVSEAYANAGKTEKAEAYLKMASRFSN